MTITSLPTVLTGFALSVVLLLGASQPAHADQREEAKTIFRVGAKAFSSGQYLMAATAFEQAYKKAQIPTVAFSMAQAYRLQYAIDGDPRWLKRSVELYRIYLSQQKSGGRRTDAAANLAELAPVLSALEAKSRIEAVEIKKQTMMMVSSQVEGAMVSIGGGELQSMPLGKELKPGRYEVIVEAEGYFTFKEDREVFAGQFRAVEVSLKAKPGSISVRAESSASVSVDGRLYGVTPLARPIEVPAGTHLITVSKKGRIGYSREFSVERGGNLDLSAPLKMSGQRKGALWTMGASGAILLAAGGYGVAAFLADNDASDFLSAAKASGGLTPSQQSEYNSARTRRDDRRTTSFALLGVGAVVATTGALLYFMESPQVEQAPGRIMITPMVGSDTQGMAVSGHF
ncbi:MAG: PEGA domain-containing protein [Kofleriaceae bacterium]|nr:PEGA domain-containing protein [Kofleriaceae bacterium]